MTTGTQEPTKALVKSDHRQRVIDRLAELYSVDRIEVDEYERRVEAIEGAATLEEMKSLILDLDPS